MLAPVLCGKGYIALVLASSNCSADVDEAHASILFSQTLARLPLDLQKQGEIVGWKDGVDDAYSSFGLVFSTIFDACFLASQI